MEPKRTISKEGMVVTPHYLASQSALAILREGGTAMEAMVAAAATVAVVYPHMNSIGGDSFWIIVPPKGEPFCIDASGPAGSLATLDFFKGHDRIPTQGPKSAITVAGTISGWQKALDYVVDCGYKRLSIQRLLADAVKYAAHGYPASRSLIDALNLLHTQDNITDDISKYFMPGGRIPEEGDILKQPELAKTLEYLSQNGLDSFYRGDMAGWMSEDMDRIGMPITKDDLQTYEAEIRKPLKLTLKCGVAYNVPPPTQGLVSLSILGILEKLEIERPSDTDFIHASVEATKQGFLIRDEYITDPAYMKVNPEKILESHKLEEIAGTITNRASSIGKGKGPGGTVWMGAMDRRGYSVSFIQSVYHSFGSGVILPITGILWQNRGVSFSLKDNHILEVKPGKKPFHTLNPAAARLKDGRVMIYGSQGGDGQSQFQAAIFHRYVVQDIPLQKTLFLPRWMYGPMIEDPADNLKIEARFGNNVKRELEAKGHKVVMLPDYSEACGHAGALVRHPDGRLEGAFDPRSDGSVVAF